MSVSTGTPLLPTYARFPVTFVDGEGCWLIADDGQRYLDLVAGHRRRQPRPLPSGAARGRARAARAALARLEPLLDRADGEPRARLLSERFGGAHAFFCNSGTEAVEAAIKWARKSTGKTELVALEGSFHGRTMGALSITGQPASRRRSSRSSRASASRRPRRSPSAVGPETAAIFLEPVQGEGGVRPLPTETLEEARALADEHDAMLVFDEVQTGVGRTGEFFAWQAHGVEARRGHAREGARERPPDRRAPRLRRARRPASSPATTPRRSAATPSRARRPAPSSRRSTTTCSRTSGRSASASRRSSAETRGAGLLLAVELGRPAGPGRARRARAQPARRHRRRDGPPAHAAPDDLRGGGRPGSRPDPGDAAA